MSLNKYKEIIEENDLVMLYIDFSTIIPIKVTEWTVSKKGNEIENICQTKYGALKVSDLIGKKFGCRVNLMSANGFAHALHPTPELWTKALPHRTQILYATDIAMIILQLDLKPGSVVVESGTGSGSLSHSLIRTIAPTGHLHTFDFHKQRRDKAEQEFEEHGIKDYVTCYHKDACEEGFGLENVADAVFLDLPHPWDAINSAKKALKKSGGRVCSFSPCIEQVQQTCEKLKIHGFTEVNTIECLLRELQVRRITIPDMDPENDPIDDYRNPQRVKGGDCKDRNFIAGLPLYSMPGHTGYLTFATLPAQLS